MPWNLTYLHTCPETWWLEDEMSFLRVFFETKVCFSPVGAAGWHMTHIQFFFIIFIALLQLLEWIYSHQQYARYTHDVFSVNCVFDISIAPCPSTLNAPPKKNRLVTDHPQCPTPPVGFQITSRVFCRGKMGFEEIVANFNFNCTKLLGFQRPTQPFPIWLTYDSGWLYLYPTTICS